MPRGPSFACHSCIISQNRSSRKHDSLGEIIWLIGEEECSGSCRGKDTGRPSSSKVMCGPFYCRDHVKFTQKFTQMYLHVLSWPKSSFELFHNILQRTQMNFLANPQLYIYIKYIYIYFIYKYIYIFFYEGSFPSLNAELILRFPW